MNELEKKPQSSGTEPSKQELYQLKRLQKEEKLKIAHRKRLAKKAVNVVLIILIAGGAIFGLGWFVLTRPSLPPTNAQGHTEDMPQSHVSYQPIPDSMQRHMLEHADGRGKPGIIIQYNCKKYSCEPDLIQKLTDLAKQYPDNVYLAPNDYDAKIVLTKLGQQEILESFDEDKIKKFIEY